ncbi:aminotransferase class I/II-fold pyridoxal phosphate-dependent enzyme [Candidatus Parcubacteria bacterium]|nr:aminotransferase class I/II-fold pyridoxal phosphate-dependent enzyme [Candidatus Parcubacteria bacterium]
MNETDKKTGQGTEDIKDDWRGLVAERCGGENFDAPGEGYSFSKILAEERELEKGNIKGDPSSALIKLSVADPVWKMQKEAMEAAMLFYKESLNATRYTDLTGIFDGNPFLNKTNEEICRLIVERKYAGISDSFSVDWVQYSPGSIKMALSTYISTAFFDKDTLIIFPTPGYPVIISPMNRNGAMVEEVAMNQTKKGWEIPFNYIGSREKVFLYFNVPHNPTGMTYSREELKEIVDWAIKRNVRLVVDEAYDDIRYDDSVSILEIPGWEQCCIVLKSVSKGYNATGLRFGIIIAKPTAIKALRKAMDVKDSGLFGPSIAAGLECSRHPEWTIKTKRDYRKLHQLLANGLKKAGFEDAGIPGAGLCQLTKAPRAVDGHCFESLVECVQYFRENLQISVMHYEVNSDWFFRWAVTFRPMPEYGLPTEESVIEEAVSRLQQAELVF